MTPTQFGAMAIGDLDNDGYMEVVVSGEDATFTPISKIYRNVGNDGFEEASALPGAKNSSVDLGDFDNDGDLDLLILGANSSDVYRNEGNFQFAAMHLGLPLVKTTGSVAKIINTSAAAWGDYDNDGDLDVLLSGVAIPDIDGDPTVLYRNDGGGVFSRVVLLPELRSGSIEWGDVDNDGDLDLLVTSQPALQAPVTTVWRNNRGAGFEDLQSALPGLESGSASWGDVDNDGYLDVLLAGTLANSNDTITQVYRNLGNSQNNAFVDLQTQLPAADYSTWIDFDHDGQRDVLLNRFSGNEAAGKSLVGPVSIELYRNTNAQGQFSATNADLEGIWFGSISTGDLNRDGSPDILAAGGVFNDQGSIQELGMFYYRNNVASPNQAPTTPDNLRSAFNDNDLVLEWTAASDLDNSHASITYNVRIGTTPGGSDVLSAMSLADGTRQVAKPGNAGHITRMVIRDLDPSQRYYWSVQAVDASFLGSAFAPESISTDIETEGDVEVPTDIALLGNYPNPFNPGTTIQYTLPERSHVQVTVYNALGSKVMTLVSESLPAGHHEVYWNGLDARGRTVPSGLYIYRLEAQNQTLSRTMVLLK